MMFFGGGIKDFRRSLGLDVNQFAKKLGCKAPNIYRIEACKNLSEARVKAIAQSLGVSVNTLLGKGEPRVEEVAENCGAEDDDSDLFFRRLDMMRAISSSVDKELKAKFFKTLEEVYKRTRQK